ncbi:MAG: type IV toxin-antitoxin system AbiEi family antitoxin domain-containing protein [Actinomycetota bacterium]
MAADRGIQRSPLGALQHEAGRRLGLVTRAQALKHGLSHSTIHRYLSRGDWRRACKNVYAFCGYPPSWEQHALAVCLSLGAGAYLCRRAAARLWDLEGIEESPVEVYVPNRKGHRSDGVILCRTDSLPRKDATHMGVFPLTSVTRTLIDLGAACDEEAVEIALECALRRSLTSLPRLRRRLDELGGCGRRGCRTL